VRSERGAIAGIRSEEQDLSQLPQESPTLAMWGAREKSKCWGDNAGASRWREIDVPSQTMSPGPLCVSSPLRKIAMGYRGYGLPRLETSVLWGGVMRQGGRGLKKGCRSTSIRGSVWHDVRAMWW